MDDQRIDQCKKKMADSGGPAQLPGDGPGQIVCKRCGQTGPPLRARPFKGPVGEQVWASVCPACWQEWIRTGTKVINELRLDFANPRHAEVYDEHMKVFLNLG